jgi:hypothetical protein
MCRPIVVGSETGRVAWGSLDPDGWAVDDLFDAMGEQRTAA